jgi:hypothetical protein
MSLTCCVSLYVVLIMTVVLQHGVGGIKRALVTGNYYKPSGVYYGGKELTPAARILLQIADDLVNSRPLRAGVDPAQQRAIMIDVHSGLGPSGVDTLAVDTEEEVQNIERIFPTEYLLMHSQQEGRRAPGARPKAGLKDASMGSKAAGSDGSSPAAPVAGYSTALGGYDLMVGGTTQGFADRLLPHLTKNVAKHAVTQEFGTVNMVVTGQRVATENYAHHHSTSALERRVAGENLRSCFFVNTTKWKFAVARRGVIVLGQAVQHLSVSALQQ